MTATQHDDAGAPSRALFARIGEALYGPEWRQPLAAALDVNPRRVRAWCAGEEPVPAGVWRELYEIIMLRREELAQLLDEFPE